MNRQDQLNAWTALREARQVLDEAYQQARDTRYRPGSRQMAALEHADQVYRTAKARASTAKS